MLLVQVNSCPTLDHNFIISHKGFLKSALLMLIQVHVTFMYSICCNFSKAHSSHMGKVIVFYMTKITLCNCFNLVNLKWFYYLKNEWYWYLASRLYSCISLQEYTKLSTSLKKRNSCIRCRAQYRYKFKIDHESNRSSAV